MNEKTIKQPNLFDYATSELSQDAFICWLLSWASPELKDFDKDLHGCAINLIKAFFDKHKINVPSEIDQIEVTKQDKNIDVLCVINAIYPILIEDKTGSTEHSNQLARYLKDVKGRFEEKNIIPIYFKTEDQASYSNVKKNGYQPFLRQDILSILNAYKGTNIILIDYRCYIQSITDQVESYKTEKISNTWGWYAWVGFYLELQNRLDSADCAYWDYVANPAGGFLGFWWHYQGDENCKQYLQLEQDKFCFKIWVKNKEERKSLRKKWHKIIKEKGQDYGLELVRPSRFGYGNYMTVCVFKGEYRESDNGKINLEKTIDRLKKAEKLLKSVKEKPEK